MRGLASNLRSKHWTRTLCHYVRFASTVPRPAAGYKESQPLSERKPARTRFAPSPTGFLHLGSLRTALFNFLIARATGGQFILRIEDTDQKRTVPGAIDRLYDDLKWAGLEWDEGTTVPEARNVLILITTGPDIQGPYGPYQQSQRLSIYKKYAEHLLESGHAYRCFCTPYRLAALASHQNSLGLPIQYDRHCTFLPQSESDARAAGGESNVIRLLAPDRYPSFKDLVYGMVQQKEKPKHADTHEDPILLKSDGFPTYHLANVVDDHLMKITDVIRGAEWMVSTHKHIALYDALGWDPPSFAHVGLLLDKSKQKLSKRAGSVDVSSFRAQGIFPESLTNFLALLGWSHNRDNDVMSLEDLIKHASMKYTRGDSIVSLEKLDFLQRRHARRYASAPKSENPSHSLHHLAVLPIVKELNSRAEEEKLLTYSKIPMGEARESYVHRILEIDSNNYVNPRDFILRNIYFFAAPSSKTLGENMPKIFAPKKTSPVTVQKNLETLLIIFRVINEIDNDEWDSETLRKRLFSAVEQLTDLSQDERNAKDDSTSLEKKKAISKSWSKLVHEYLRWALCAGKPGPDGVAILLLLGKSTVSERLLRGEKLVKEMMQQV